MRTGPQVQRALEEVDTLYRVRHSELNKQQSLERKRIQDTCPHDTLVQMSLNVYCHWCSKFIKPAIDAHDLALDLLALCISWKLENGVIE
jgi:hypothetical protein